MTSNQSNPKEQQNQQNSINKIALVMAGGTGGHIFPGLAVAHALREKGWQIHWIGGFNSMESRLIPEQNIPFEALEFSGVRGKGLRSWLFLPFRLLRVLWRSWQIIQKIKPQVILGFGGYISFPVGLMAILMRKPLILHEQNAVAGLVNRVLERAAFRVFTAFPDVFPRAIWAGNPLRAAFKQQAAPSIRFENRSGVLRLLVVGGSLGARALNDLVPKALALLPVDERPIVCHQSGAKELETLRQNYESANVRAEMTAFIDDTASAFAQADLIICRAGASTVTEIAAVGAAALFVPFPAAVDDHQTKNAQFLVNANGGWLWQQHEITPEKLAQFIQNLTRAQLLNCAVKAKEMQQITASDQIVQTCETLYNERFQSPKSLENNQHQNNKNNNQIEGEK